MIEKIEEMSEKRENEESMLELTRDVNSQRRGTRVSETQGAKRSVALNEKQSVQRTSTANMKVDAKEATSPSIQYNNEPCSKEFTMRNKRQGRNPTQ